MSSWKILGLHVPLATIQVNEMREDFEGESLDLRQNVPTLQQTQNVQGDDVIPKSDENVRRLDNFDDGFFNWKSKRRTIIQQITDAKAVAKVVASGGKAAYSMVVGETQKLSSAEVRWKMCKYAEILLSPELSICMDKYQWNKEAYLEFNRLASKIQGEVAQQLAFSCNFCPPEGFARISNWTRSSIETRNNLHTYPTNERHHTLLTSSFPYRVR